METKKLDILVIKLCQEQTHGQYGRINNTLTGRFAFNHINPTGCAQSSSGSIEDWRAKLIVFSVDKIVAIEIRPQLSTMASSEPLSFQRRWAMV